jgi:hypothetical protein
MDAHTVKPCSSQWILAGATQSVHAEAIALRFISELLEPPMVNQSNPTRSIHGLKPDCLPFGEVLAQSFAVIAPTTIPASNLGLIVALAGSGTWLSFLIGMVGLTFVSLNINQFASRSASPGSLYSYIAKGLGPTAGVVCGWSLVLAYLFTGMSVLCGFANFSDMLLGHLGIHLSSLTLLTVGAAIAWYAAYNVVDGRRIHCSHFGTRSHHLGTYRICPGLVAINSARCHTWRNCDGISVGFVCLLWF